MRYYLLEGVKALLDYLRQELHLPVSSAPWDSAKELPIYMAIGHEFSIVTVGQQETLCIATKNNAAFSLRDSKRIFEQVRARIELPVFLCLHSITHTQKRSLIQSGIPFVVPGNQIYLPFLGISLQSKCSSAATIPQQITMPAQMILLWLLYQDGTAVFAKKELAQALGLTSMTVSRATQQLHHMALICEEPNRQDKRYVDICLARPKEYYWTHWREGLRSPVDARIYLRPSDVSASWPAAGESCLAQRSMLNPPMVPVRAISKAQRRGIAERALLSPDLIADREYVEVEVWKYDPQCLAKDSQADPLSVAASFIGNPDERIEGAVEEMLEDHTW